MRAQLVHLELHTGAADAALDLFTRLFGWRSEWISAPDGFDYLAFDLGSGLSGGIVASDVRSSLWLPYLEVGSVEAASEQASDFGANILVPPRDGPTGTRSVITTSAGAQLAFWRSR